MTLNIKGITRTALWSGWKAVRQELKKVPHRDVIDFLEYDLDPNVWINRLLRQISEGHYEPTTPMRYTLAKSKGFSRLITRPHIPDVVLYRAIADYLYRKGKRSQAKHAYFLRATLNEATRDAVQDAKEILETDPLYRTGSKRSFLQWLKFDQYRKHLIFDRVHRFIVITDITNFFDSVIYDRIKEPLYGLRAPPKMIGLLFFILEKLSPRDAYTQSPRIGLPVDEFDCSRTLAHMVLFPHDERVVARVGEDAYVRWMDDQNMGVASKSEGLRVLGLVGDSLRRLHLTANAGKSKVLSLNEAKEHFHFNANAKLDETERLIADKRPVRLIRHSFLTTWKSVLKGEGHGEWAKLLKRCYRLAALAKSRRLRSRGVRDVLAYPELVERIADYIRCTGTTADHIAFVNKALTHPEQVYPDVNHALLESLLRAEAGKREARLIRQWAVKLLRGRTSNVGAQACVEVAPLLLLRFGDGRSARLLKTCLDRDLDRQPTSILRACAVVYLSYGNSYFEHVRRVAARVLRNPLGDLVKMVEKIRDYDEMPERFNPRLALRFDAVKGTHYVDMRSILQGRLLALNSKPSIGNWLRNKKRILLRSTLSAYDKRLIKKLL
jgi:hypothetical protein